MAEVVVDVLEVVEIEERERESAVAPPYRTLHALFDHHAIGQSSQLVQKSPVRQIVFELLAISDVDRRGKEKRLADDLRRLVGGKPRAFSARVRNDIFGAGRLTRLDERSLPRAPFGGLVLGEEIGG